MYYYHRQDSPFLVPPFVERYFLRCPLFIVSFNRDFTVHIYRVVLSGPPISGPGCFDALQPDQRPGGC